MRRAAQLLEIEAITSREVAERVGYDLESSFARTFKKYYGVSPRAFAARYRNLRHCHVNR
jgi:AraC-like DNA-binding protein